MINLITIISLVFQVVCTTWAWTVVSAGLAVENSPRPNIILIMCDDLGYADVGFNGAKDIMTPNLDALARAGTVCTSGYVAHPFCGPSRMGLMAGRYPHAFGAPFNLPNSGQGYEEYNRKGIPVSETLISTVLQKSGYFTGAIGKWHMGIDPQFHPNQRGFDDYYGFLGGGHEYFPEKYVPIYERQVKAKKKFFNEYIVPLEHNGKPVQETEYMTDALSRESVRFIKQAADRDEPFFLYVAYNAPHTPLQAKEEDLVHYANIKDEKRRIYAAMVHAVDRGIGEIVNALQATNALDKTLIVFLSDNGGKIGAGADNTPLKRGKGSVYEGGIRVPMFFHWPGNVPSGIQFGHPVSALDFYPTIAGLAGAKIPTGKKLDGKNIWEDFIAGRNPRQDELVFAMRHHNGFSNAAARQNEWKACCVGRSWQLYNVQQDIGEEHDLSKQHPERLQSIISQVESWSRSHSEPEWFDSLKARDQWTEHGMPNPEAIFPTGK